MIESIDSISTFKEIVETEFSDTVLIYVDSDPEVGMFSEELDCMQYEFRDRLRIYQIDMLNEELIDYLSVNDVPTMILYKSYGDEILRYEGFIDATELHMAVSTNI